MKRMSDMEGEAPIKRARPTGDTEVRLLIQSKAAGSVIGKGGSNISRLRSENPASITVPDCPGPERVLTVGGSEEAALKVLGEILESLDEAQQKSSGDTDVRMLVHQSQAGCIIGKGGSKIKELREECGSQIKVFTNCCPQSTDRVVQISGERDRALMTITRIVELLKQSPIKGISNAYNPHHFDEFFSSDYGGWGDASNKGGRFGGPPQMGGRGPPQMGLGGPMGRGPMGGLAGAGLAGPAPFGRRPMGGPQRGIPPQQRLGGNDDYGDMHKNKGFMNGGNMNHMEDNLPTTSTQVTIPKDSAGAIIGKGGARIRKIRSDSGCSISIDDPKPGSEERIITITGSEPQIKHAQYLLQQSILSVDSDRGDYGGHSGGGRRY